MLLKKAERKVKPTDTFGTAMVVFSRLALFIAAVLRHLVPVSCFAMVRRSKKRIDCHLFMQTGMAIDQHPHASEEGEQDQTKSCKSEHSTKIGGR